MPRRQFLLFSDMGGDTDDQIRRSVIDPVGDIMWIDSLKDGRRVKKPSKPPRFRIAPPLPRVEDMPWCGMAHVVSNRFRRFLQQEAPGHAQFFKAELTGSKKLLQAVSPACPYYVVNWLHVVDCIDLKKTQYDLNDELDEDPDYTFFRLTLSPAKVPRDVSIFRLKHEVGTVVIDAQLANKIEAAGITGPQFDEVHGITDAMGL